MSELTERARQLASNATGQYVGDGAMIALAQAIEALCDELEAKEAHRHQYHGRVGPTDYTGPMEVI